MGKAKGVDLDAGGRTVTISSPDKVVLAAGPHLERDVTKLDLARYAIAVGPGLVRAVAGRPTSLERWPDGYREGMHLTTRQGEKGEGFYSKRLPRYAPDWVEGVEVTFPSGRTATQWCPRELADVVWAINQNTLTFHPWPVRASHVDHPDQLRVDLDPQPGTDVADAAALAPLVREVAAEAGLVLVPKTSGGRGLHLFAAIRPEWDFVQARHAVIALAREVCRRAPDQATVSWWKEERGQRIFLDYNQMARDRTMASAYSPRPNLRGTVSAPLAWEEVGSVHPDDFTVLSMPERFERVGDLFADADDGGQAGPGSLATLLQWWERDVEAGEGELPYPPEYPKMPGEPPRVQPSRARKD